MASMGARFSDNSATEEALDDDRLPVILEVLKRVFIYPRSGQV